MTRLRQRAIAAMAQIESDPSDPGSALTLRNLSREIYECCAESRPTAWAGLEIAFADPRWAARALDMAFLSAIIGLQLQLPPALCRDATLAALVCDLGAVLLPPGTGPEVPNWALHARLSVDLMPTIDGRAREGVLAHHERLDGSGAPFGVEGESIGVVARVVAVADEYAQLRARSVAPAAAMETLRSTGLPGLDRAIFGALVEARSSNLTTWGRVPA